MIVGIILAIFLGLGSLLFMTQYLPNVMTQTIETIMQPFILMVDKGFYFLAAIIPILCAVIPLYILREREDKALIMGALYGLALMFIVIGFGFGDVLMGYFNTSWTTSWAATLGAFANILYALFFWLWGALLYIADAVLDGIVKLGRPAGVLRGAVIAEKERWKAKKS